MQACIHTYMHYIPTYMHTHIIHIIFSSIIILTSYIYTYIYLL